ncbi:MAG: hypothetical protein A2469_02050 [Candidatus Magasanikbacteria bacterium RIFOXYC2_FULL_40_16]|uniref:PpiC domain-containing protein n=2 Tax=Candidatus Magasanikiibacteriota TaxID=1752731 RepID=A0A1F6NFQ2_9BACT|nr:MAG: hypothetical protein A2224_02095 [Candidatus Magasanikbacteria bacterium RIFOXYA2_FULL_40_20]OGH82659.1 MAG: hypothetical protein A2373_02235 [Candidatus Magasanikbacteria bacterium RIFOXYB1_FULL_40_15]OGH86418.1 MAG: hypothetical protein A2301_03340 [Candidatus Magasanikbacteria bacterium RIFOXYB2_FULL_40_13]OGH89777.1 MAG: hypothetical protein A2469_02050 [Candidatus Magasanikbacteria bacterium RIFOXYC2_FULL_40_16]
MEESKIEKQEESTENKGGPMKWKFFAMGIATLLVLVGVFGVVYSVFAVKYGSKSPAIVKVAEVLNLPVAHVNGMAIPYYLYVEDVNTLNAFYKKVPAGSMAPVTEENVSDQVLSRLIVNSIIKEIAREAKIAATEEDVQEAKTSIFSQYPSEADVEKELSEQYGWDIPTYVEKIVKPMIIEKKVSEAFELGEILADVEGYSSEEEISASHILFRTDGEDVDEEEVKEIAEAVLERAKGGEDFAALATEFGSDATKDAGGSLGWFGRGMMVPEFEEAVFAVEPGQVGAELVETEFGYHIVKVDGKRSVRDFGVYLDDKIGEASFEILVKGVHDPLADYRKLQEEAKQARAEE